MPDDNVRQVCMDLFSTLLEGVLEEPANSVKICVTDHAAPANGKMLALVDQLRSELVGQPAALDQQMLGVVRRNVVDASRRFQEQIDVCTGTLQDHGGRISFMEGDVDELKKQMRELRDQLALVEKRPQTPLAVPQGCERDVDATVVVIMCHAATTKQLVCAALKEWLGELGFPESDYDISPAGQAPCKKFTLKFGGLVAAASRKARMHLGPDKNPRHIKTEMLLRRRRSVIPEAHPNLRLFSDRDRGALSVGWGRILRVEVAAGAAPATAVWDPAASQDHIMRKNNLAQLTRHLVAPQVAGVQLDIFNVHNRELTALQVAAVARFIRGARAFAARGPTKRLAIVSGGCNFSSEEAAALRMPRGAVRRAARRHHAQAPTWRRALAELLEAESTSPTLNEKASNSGSCVDRLFLSCPGWTLRQLFLQ
ncbi:unnamed protein product, partial [Prorocentrum cordatum]